MELSITELRAQRRPLWMSYFAAENFADLVGGGGEIWFDRLPLRWESGEGHEIEGDVPEEALDLPEEIAQGRPN